MLGSDPDGGVQPPPGPQRHGDRHDTAQKQSTLYPGQSNVIHII